MSALRELHPRNRRDIQMQLPFVHFHPEGIPDPVTYHRPGEIDSGRPAIRADFYSLKENKQVQRLKAKDAHNAQIGHVYAQAEWSLLVACDTVLLSPA